MTSKRIFDFLLSILLIILFSGIFLMISIIVSLTSEGPILYWSDRVGKDGNIYRMPKFRTMIINTPEVATDLLNNPKNYLTPVGKFLRETSLDELPQLFSILIGQMSFVGPRPALFNQCNLISKRKQEGIDQLLPGITGWAQINGRDTISDKDKLRFDKYYLDNMSFLFDLKILILTFFSVIKKDGITH